MKSTEVEKLKYSKMEKRGNKEIQARKPIEKSSIKKKDRENGEALETRLMSNSELKLRFKSILILSRSILTKRINK